MVRSLGDDDALFWQPADGSAFVWLARSGRDRFVEAWVNRPGDDDMVQTWFDEAGALVTRLVASPHRGLPRVHRTLGAAGALFELAGGLSLGTVVTRLGGLDVPTAVRAVAEAAEALGHLGRLLPGYAHGGLGLDVLEAAPERPTRLRPPFQRGGYLRRSSTAIELPRGLCHLAPELVRGLPLDPRSDVWALGSLVVTLLLGRAPFARGSDLETLQAIISADAPPQLRGRVAGVTAALDAVLASALSRAPEARFASPAALAEALRGTLSDVEPGLYRGPSRASPFARAATPLEAYVAEGLRAGRPGPNVQGPEGAWRCDAVFAAWASGRRPTLHEVIAVAWWAAYDWAAFLRAARPLVGKVSLVARVIAAYDPSGSQRPIWEPVGGTLRQRCLRFDADDRDCRACEGEVSNHSGAAYLAPGEACLRVSRG